MRRILCVLMVFFTMLLVGCAQASGETEVLVLKIGKADAIIIMAEGHAVLIDAGEAEDGEEILQKLAERNIRSLDAMIITHYDKDHVGGADAVLEGIPVQAVYDADYECDNNEQYEEYLEAIQATGVPRYRVSQKVSISSGSLSFTLMPTDFSAPAQSQQEEIDNDQSVVISLTDGSHTFFFAGDAEETRIEELLSNGISPHDVLKMPHHGRMKKNLAAFLDAVAPSAAIITDSDKNPAEDEVLGLLSERGIATYETRNGDILIISGKSGLSINQ